jgi:tetratricopeptide (TPR) repeat protein
MLGKVGQAFRDLEKGAEYADRAGNEPRKTSMDFVQACIYYDLGKFDLSQKYLQKMYDVRLDLYPSSESEKAWHNYYIGLTDVRAGRVDSAKSQLEKMMSHVSEFDPFLTFVATVRSNWLQAEIWVAEGLMDKAIELLESQESGSAPYLEVDYIGPYNIPLIRDTLARAYLEKGDIDEAIAFYEKQIKFDPQGKERRLIHPKYYYLVGKLYEEKGEKSTAIARYGRFLDLWKDADPDLPELDDVRKRLVGLENK